MRTESRDEIVSGYGRGQYTARVRPVPWVVEAAAWVVLLLGGPLLVMEIGSRLARVVMVATMPR